MRIRKEKIRFFETRLLDYLRKAGRAHLPWRKRGVSAYEVWVSEIMLQQTQVNRVVDYYTRFIGNFPTVRKLALASWEEFLPYYQGLGYYARGRNMLRTAKEVAERHGGEFPRQQEALEALPGIGPYTAAAILSFAYGDKHLAWDTNLKRIFGRFFFGAREAVLDEAYFEERLAAPRRKLNAALMDFGSALCTARPKCEACMLKSRCAYYLTAGREEKGAIRARERFPTTEAQVCLFLHEDHRRYFSSRKDGFVPFLLPAAYNTRAGIKEYFRKRYGLELAVRPPHKKGYSGKTPTLFVNAQILLGTAPFRAFPKTDAAEKKRRWEEGRNGTIPLKTAR